MKKTILIYKIRTAIRKKATLLFLFNISFSQWAGYDISQVEYSSSDLRTFIESTAFGLSANPFLILSPEKRVYVGATISKNALVRSNTYQHQLSGLVPKFSADVFITNNLYFIGGLSQFYTNNDIVHSHNYGIALTSGEDAFYPWQTSVVFFRLTGPKDLTLRTVSLNLSTVTQVMNYQIQAGLGKEMYSATFFLNDVNFPTGMKGEINYLLLGIELEKGSFGIVPQIRVHPGLIGVSVGMTLGID